MSRYIDVDDALEVLTLMYDNQADKDDPYNVGVMGAINYIKHKAPSIEIVHCRECIHCADDWIDVGMGTMPQFTCELGMCSESVQPNDFCSYGEREGE